MKFFPLPHKYEHPVFGFLLSGMMSFIVCGIATLRAVGLSEVFFEKWLSAWAFAWPVAFVTVLFVAPFVRRLVKYLVRGKDNA